MQSPAKIKILGQMFFKVFTAFSIVIAYFSVTAFAFQIGTVKAGIVSDLGQARIRYTIVKDISTG